MGNKKTDTLGEALRHRGLIEAACACGHSGRFEAPGLVAWYGAGKLVREIRFKCTNCGASVRGQVVIPELVPKAPLPPAPIREKKPQR